ncbi:DUF3253 domain-containing protein [Oculatella sp. FACHB-28]|nr:DUF3253 domain-containing protein [Cyanobacteria bacterium FACHB-471]MBD2055068.1 DUF3253 domain-containing protein [Oculatella sp. FACHB-28]
MSQRDAEKSFCPSEVVSLGMEWRSRMETVLQVSTELVESGNFWRYSEVSPYIRLAPKNPFTSNSNLRTSTVESFNDCNNDF